jgi:hypothetical protein
MSKKITWDPRFGPSYSPEEMLRMGVFEGKYINAVKGVPASWKKIPKVLGPNDEPDEKLNYYGVKSRQPLSVWKKNGWTTKDSPLGWAQWYFLYYLGRRIEKEDDWQIGRWRSFVARHQGQINADPKSNEKDRRLVQKQALLNWGWNWKDSFTPEKVLANAKKMAKETDSELEEKEIATESIILPKWYPW